MNFDKIASVIFYVALHFLCQLKKAPFKIWVHIFTEKQFFFKLLNKSRNYEKSQI